MSGPFGSQQWMYASGGFYPYELDNSLKFEDGDSSYLSRTPSSAGNQKVFTFSCWLKRGNLTDINLLGAGTGSDDRTDIAVLDNAILFGNEVSNDRDVKKTNAVLRDTSAWYHIVVAIDLTASSNSDKVKIYINGVQQTSFAIDNTFANVNSYINGTSSTHYIGRNRAGTDKLDGYLAEVNFIDGTQLTPSSFGETKEGIWIPKQYSGSYGTNGFYLPFKETTTANGFNTVTYSGNGGDQSIEGVGFQPDFVWTKQRNASANHRLFDSVRGTGKNLISNSTTSEGTDSNTLTSFDSDGFSLGNSTQVNDSSDTYVAWCWDAGTGDKTYTVTVYNSGYGNKYRFDGNSTDAPTLNLAEGATYTFNYPSAHPLRFSTTSNGTHGGGTEYTTGVTHVSSTQTTITVASGAPTLYYYCSIHSGMGGQINTNSTQGSSHLEGSIISTVKANQEYGFSIVSYTGTGAAATVGHGLGVIPAMVITKRRDGTSEWMVKHQSLPTGQNLLLNQNLNAAASLGYSQGVISDLTSNTTFGFTSGSSGVNNANQSSATYVAYCFADVTGYQKVGSYSGTNSANNSITGLGFKPAWLMIKRTDSADDWCIYDNTRHPGASTNTRLEANDSAAEVSASSIEITFDNDGFTLVGDNSSINASGTYIYLAIADTRDALFTSDASGNGNNWTPNALQHSDVMPDTPTDGFATLNSVFKTKNANPTFSEGNLTVAPSASAYQNTISTIGVSSGKWYAEIYCNGTPNSANYFGVGNDKEINNLISTNTLVGSTDGGFGIQMLADDKRTNGSNTTGYSSAFSSGDIMNIAMDLDNGKVWFGKNGTYFSSGDPVAGSNEAFSGLSGTFYVILTMYNAGFTSATVNFGQDSSFNAVQIPQGNADSNGKGDFFYAPPSGFLALCNANLPDPAIDPNKGENPEDYFNTVLYTGNGGTKSITGVGFQPGFVWQKGRNVTYNHLLFDSVRGATKYLRSNATNAETTEANSLQSFDADGFTVANNPSGSDMSNSSVNYVAWNWKAGGTGVTNNDGSIQSTVSANTEAGFSIVSYTGTGSNATIGHGLGVAPDMIIVKNRSDGADSWQVYHSANTSAPETERLKLNGTDATLDLNLWQDTAPTSSVFYIATDGAVNGSGENLISYCFANKEGYSKFGSYTGNGSSDGPFVYTGFRPSFWLQKRTDSASGGNWRIIDIAREPFNDGDPARLFPDSNSAEQSNTRNQELLSNGIKVRSSNVSMNASGGTYIYMAFAEQPFKYSNAR